MNTALDLISRTKLKQQDKNDIAKKTADEVERKMVKKIITKKFKKALLKRLRSLIAKETPIPSTGPISGAISIAPITTAVELVFKPIEAMKIEQIKTHDVVPLKEISSLMASKVEA